MSIAKTHSKSKLPSIFTPTPFLLKSPLLEDFPNISHAFTSKKGGVSKAPYGSLNLSCKTGDGPDSVEANGALVKDTLSMEAPLFFLDQVHGNDVLVVDDLEDHSGPFSFDAAVTSREDIPLVILTADCLPLLLYDPVRGVAGAVHAGWKGTSLNIAGETVAKMKERFDCDPSHIVAAMGPAIGPCCYEVDKPVAAAFEGAGSALSHSPAPFLIPVNGKGERWMFDLVEANRLQLLNIGLRRDKIQALNYCTCCRGDLFYSYRRDGEKTGRQGALIMIKARN